MGEYAVYLTFYKGSGGLPPFYIGSTTVENIKKGYRGTVSSKKWSSLWKQLIKNDFNSFDIVILKTFNTRYEAYEYENSIQRANNVVNSPLFVNESYALFGLECSMKGELNPRYGIASPDHVKEACRKANIGKVTAFDKETNRYIKVDRDDYYSNPERYHIPSHTEETKQIIACNTSKSMSVLVEAEQHWFQSDAHKKIVSEMRLGVPLSIEHRKKMSLTRIEKYKELWLYPANTNKDFAKITIAVEYYIKNFKKHSRNSGKQFREFCGSIQMTSDEINYILKSMRYNETRLKLIDACELFKKKGNI